MKTKQLLISLLAALSLQAAIAGCVDDASDDDIEFAEPADEAIGQKADGQTLPFTVLDIKPIITDSGYVKVIKSKRQYRRIFGVEATNIDFQKEAVIVFAAGGRNTGGFKASITELSFSKGALTVAARVDAPGNDCLVTQAITFPSTVVKVALPAAVTRAKYSVKELGYSCRAEEPAACFTGGCGGQICSDQEGVITTCQFNPADSCFADATCARQADGECGWTETPELTACLAAN